MPLPGFPLLYIVLLADVQMADGDGFFSNEHFPPHLIYILLNTIMYTVFYNVHYTEGYCVKCTVEFTVTCH